MKKNERHKPAVLLQRFGLLTIIAGIIATCLSIYNFSDKNLVLMVSLGFIIGGIQTLIIGAAFQAMQMHPNKNELEPDPS
ncbi:hypothetical protein [Falsibacillus albus]|uniref:MFS transporter n=1 Tax=Falsibacillus albus TaxID=2478915 RepID=A0A3L7JQ02_9BACI|nr:hypothetical protein [Falsibacillus albus]RLQ92335.1 hypothetical protein D9X91_19895 [Falsibacillus albus]